MTRPAKQPDQDQSEPVGPAVVTRLHVQNRPVSKEAGAKLAWVKWTPLEAAFEHGKLEGGDKRYSADARLAAGKHYTTLWDLAQSSGRDSTHALNVNRGGGNGLPLTQAQSDAIRSLVTIESHMGQRDRIICRMVLGQGHFPSEAVAMVSPDYTKATSPRFREALDALADALEAARKSPGKVNMRPLG